MPHASTIERRNGFCLAIATDQRGVPAGVAGWLEGETLLTENANQLPLEVVLIEPQANQLR